MEIRITSRHTDLSDDLRERTEEVVAKLLKYEP
jgi:ribosome-associated translation inhibitor RaiA